MDLELVLLLCLEEFPENVQIQLRALLQILCIFLNQQDQEYRILIHKPELQLGLVLEIHDVAPIQLLVEYNYH